MKKTFIIILIVLFFITGCKNKTNDNNKKMGIEEKNDPIIEEKDTYIDDNPIKLRLYSIDNYNNYIPIIEYSCIWKMETTLGVFTVIPTEEEIINDNYYQTIFFRHWNSYENADNYKIGYNIKFTLKDGKTINENILMPWQTDLVFPYLFVYLYDDVNIPPGTWHSHLTNDEVKSNTKFTSIKLHGWETAENISSPIELTVFTYKNNNDFDSETGNYRGNSFYRIIIYQKK